MKIITKEVKIALVAVVGIIILFLGMNFLKGISTLSQDNTYMLSFTDIQGLSVSTPVYSNGYKIGVVKDIVFDYDKPENVIVKIGIDKKVKIPRGSYAEIRKDLMGNIKVDLYLVGNYNSIIKPGENIPGNINGGTLAEAASMIPQMQRILPKIDSLVDKLNNILNNNAINSSINNVQLITTDLTYTTKEINKLMQTINNRIPGVITKAEGTIDNAAEFSKKLNALDVERTLNAVDKTLTDVRNFTAQLNDNKSSLGLLMRDPSLYNNLNSTMRNADSLMIDLRTNPKRYVHFSIFGRKNK